MLRKFSAFILISAFAMSCKVNPDSSRNYADRDKVYRLHLNVPPGSKYNYEITNESKIKAEAENKKTENENKSTVGIYYQLDKDNSGNYLLTINYDKIHLYSKAGDAETDIDADNSAATLNPTEKMLGALKGTKISATISPRGEISNVSGYKEIGEKIIEGLNSTDPAIKNAAQLQWEKLAGNNIIKNNMDELFKIFPDSAVHIGDTWKLTSKQEGEIGLLVKNIYKLKAINNDVAIIQSEGVITADSSSTTVMGLNNVSMDLKGKQESEYEMETKTGMLISGKVTAKVEGSIYVMDREVPVEIETTLKINGRKVK